MFQGVTHKQWYLFNDFLIEPIDKVIDFFFCLEATVLYFQKYNEFFMCTLGKY